MRLRRIAAAMALISAGLAAPCGAAERPQVVVEAMTIESHRMVLDPAAAAHHGKKHVSRMMPVDVAVYRPNDGLKHPAIVYLHGGGLSFADPVMAQFHAELAKRGLVVLAPHYLLDGTGWPHWQESAANTVTLAASLPGVDADRIGLSGLSMGGQIGLSTAARDPRIKKVAEYFTAWPGSLPDEPIAKLPPVLLLNGTADPIIPFEKAMVLDAILEEHKLPFERHVYEGLGHGFSTPASFHDGLLRTAAFFGGIVGGPSPGPAVTAFAMDGLSGPTGDPFEVGDGEFTFLTPAIAPNPLTIASAKKPRRLVVKKPAAARAVASPSRSTKP